MVIKSSLTLFAAASLSQVAFAQEAYVEGESLTYSDTLNIASLLDSFRGGEFREDGEVFFTHNQGAAGVRWHGVDLALVGRYDYFAEYSSDTGQIIFAERNEQALADGDYEVDLRVNRLQAFGPRLGYRRDLFDGRLTLGAHVSGLFTSDLLDGTVEGSATVFNDGDDVSGNLLVDYAYENDLIFDREVEAPNGFGVTFDISAAVQITDRLSASIEVKDLWSRIWYSDAPRSFVDATTNRANLDDAGLLVVRPALRGRNFTEDVTQRYFTRTKTEASYKIADKWTVSQDVVTVRDVVLSTSKVSYEVTDKLSISGEVEWASGAIGAGVKWGGLRASVTSNNVDFGDATYLKASVGYVIKF